MEANVEVCEENKPK